MEQKARVSPYPIPELAEYLRPFREHFYRCESLHTLERFATGLLSNLQRKSGAGVAQAVADLSEGAAYRLMAETEWDEAAFNRQRVGTMLAGWVAGDGVLVVDEGSYPRKGDKCVGVARQYCGELGKVDNCQVFVTTHYMDPYFAWPVNGQLYLPEKWADDPQRRAEAQIPEDVVFQTKPGIALDLVDEARQMGVLFEGVVADGVYGGNPAFLDGLETRGLWCGVAVPCDFGVRLSEEMVAGHAPVHRADAVVVAQPDCAWEIITWRQGSEGPLTKHCVALRVHRAVGEWTGREGWLVGECPVPGEEVSEDKDKKIKYYWSDLPADTPLARLVELLHRRPGIERGYQDGKGETGQGDYPARLWRSFHRHLAIETLVLTWLIRQRPRPQSPVIQTAPQPVEDPRMPVFPLWPRTVSERAGDSA